MIAYYFNDEWYYFEEDSKKVSKKLREYYLEGYGYREDINEHIMENYDELLEEYKDFIEEDFKEDAYEMYLDSLACTKNKSMYYGV